MTQPIKLNLFVIAATFLLPSISLSVEWELLPSGNAHDVEIRSTTENRIELKTTGSDPYIVGKLIGELKGTETVLAFEYFCPDGIDDFSIYWGKPFSGRQHKQIRKLSIAEGWRKYSVDLRDVVGGPLSELKGRLRFDFGHKPNVSLGIRDIRIRELTQQEIEARKRASAARSSKIREAAAIAEYLGSDFPASMTVAVETDRVAIKFTNTTAGIAYRLVEYRPMDSIGKQAVPGQKHSIDAGKSDLPRYVDGYDRLNSAWRLHDGKRFVSARTYASTIACGTDDHANDRVVPISQKGLTCLSRRGPLEDIVDLGVHAVTWNVPLTRFVSHSAKPHTTELEIDGKKFFFREDVLRSYEPLIDFCRRNKIVVSAIVLLPMNGQFKNPSLMIHPESDGGTYAMPNLTSQTSVNLYAYVLDRIADHFSNTQQFPGGVTNWIAHNEIDFHPVWTNMGKQPRELVTETYYRSMRMIHNIAVSHNPNARVFASLTHHWNLKKQDTWDQLSPRDVVQTLQRYSQMEGDFGWGIAYHPYPQSLFADIAWNDTRAEQGFDTPLITIQNLEVLGRFLGQPTMLSSDGKVRPVLLSEQGFHTQGTDQPSQDNQAASLLFAMNKVRKMPWIEAFIYHRWIDHPHEGGLALGLRGFPSQQHPHGKRKRSWFVYQAIGTDKEQTVTRGLRLPSN